MLSPQMAEALSQHLQAEFASAYLYLSMAACLESSDLPGMASWMKSQAHEETLHALKVYSFILERDGKVKLLAVAEPPCEWDSPAAVFESALEHEQEISEKIHRLVELAGQLKDHATRGFLQWFVSEQVEEEATVRRIAGQLKLVGKDPSALFLLDRELGSRKGPAAGGGGE